MNLKKKITLFVFIIFILIIIYLFSYDNQNPNIKIIPDYNQNNQKEKIIENWTGTGFKQELLNESKNYIFQEVKKNWGYTGYYFDINKLGDKYSLILKWKDGASSKTKRRMYRSNLDYLILGNENKYFIGGLLDKELLNGPRGTGTGFNGIEKKEIEMEKISYILHKEIVNKYLLKKNNYIEFKLKETQKIQLGKYLLSCYYGMMKDYTHNRIENLDEICIAYKNKSFYGITNIIRTKGIEREILNLNKKEKTNTGNNSNNSNNTKLNTGNNNLNSGNKLKTGN